MTGAPPACTRPPSRFAGCVTPACDNFASGSHRKRSSRSGRCVMTNPTERDILANLRSLRSIEPSKEATRTAQAAASALLRQKNFIQHKTFRRIIMSTSIAALIAIVASVAWFTFAPQRATAAETLARAAAATQAYNGWVRIRYSTDTPTTQPNMPTSADMYFDNATGTTINDNTIDGHREIEMWDIPGKREVTYNSAKGEILIGDITVSFAKGWAESMMKYPITLAETIASLQEHENERPALRESNDNGLKRLDLDFAKKPPTTASTQEQEQQPKSATIWVDPKTDL